MINQEEILNEILVDMVNSGELKLGEFTKEFRLKSFDNISSINGILCSLIYAEWNMDWSITFFIDYEIFDRYVLQKNRDNIINELNIE